MSAIIIMQEGHSVHFVTDAGQYDPDTGVMVGMRSKVHVFPNAPVAFAWRGAGGDWPDMLFSHCRDLTTLQEIVSEATAYLSRIAARASSEGNESAPDGGWAMEAYFAGWVDAMGKAGCVWFSAHREPVGCVDAEPFALREAPPLSIAPGFTTPLEEVLGWPVNAQNWAKLNPARDGLALMEAQRRAPQRNGMLCAGGRAELTTVDCMGVHQYVLREWPDVIGQRIRPDLDEASLAPLGTLGAAQLREDIAEVDRLDQLALAQLESARPEDREATRARYFAAREGALAGLKAQAGNPIAAAIFDRLAAETPSALRPTIQ